MQHYSSLIQFRIDPLFSTDLRRSIDSMLSQLRGLEKSESLNTLKNSEKFTIDLISESSLHMVSPESDFKLCVLESNQGLFSFSQSLDQATVDAVLDENLDLRQIGRLIEPHLESIISKRKESFISLGIRNVRKFEGRVKAAIGKKGEEAFSSEFLLNYAQVLVDLEKELIQADELPKLEKVLKQFCKNHIERAKFQFFTMNDLGEISSPQNFLLLPLFKGEFVAIEFAWNDEDPQRLFKRLFFYHTLINFFQSQQAIKDPFFDEDLWESVLNAIPFPIALLSKSGEVHQHNTLFAKLGFPPSDCLKRRLREKILINEIPYNIFRKEIYHMDQEKVLFVFFTESFFLKGDGNLTPSGQELGIISSSIAHELNNPIAGIQAALGLLQLDDKLSTEAGQTLIEMKNGATRCKQLIETFLGFSRANPSNSGNIESKHSPIEICYQQAQNLLRFRTVESGIRFNFDSIKHAEFRSTVNPSLLTMTFYLILGELMTLYSHQLLVANKNQIEKVIRGEIVESSQEIQIQLHELNISTLSLSKLIQNLLQIENFVLQVTDYSLRFIYNP
jgi:hypothetical protein